MTRGSYIPKTNAGLYNLDDLYRLYNSIPWQLIVFNSSLNSQNELSQKYNDYFTISFFKALLLPFFMNIPTERALGRELEERGSLQALCGFQPGKIPSRGTLWNFRRKHLRIYPRILSRLLVTIAVIKNEVLDTNLPYIFDDQGKDIKSYQETERFFLTPSYIGLEETEDINSSFVEFMRCTNIEKKNTAKNKNLVRDGEKVEELKAVSSWKQWENVMYKYLEKEKNWLSLDLQLPILVKVTKKDKSVFFFKIDKPGWLEIQGRDKDTITGFGSSAIPYIACNILVTRTVEERKEILLSKRLNGFGEGTYAIPGGKLRLGEKIEECAQRELKEETALILNKSRPISFQVTHFPGKPWVLSIGALAEDYSGEPLNIETYQHDAWQWFDLKQLPDPLFSPTRIVINQYLSGIYQQIQWNDLEFIVKEEIKQSSLFSDDKEDK